MKLNSREIGKIAEDKAIKFLEENNFQIIERNFYTKFGEIDIIAKKKEILHFIEVKSGDSFEPIYNITDRKLKKIVKTLNIYLSKNSIKISYQIDALIIKNENISFIENISLFF